MGLAERISQAKVEAASRERVVRQEAQLKFKEAESARLQAQTIATQQEETKIALLIVELSPLLEVVAAREQLEEVRKVWGVGTVDTQPHLIHDRGMPSPRHDRLDLSIRFRFANVEQIFGNYGENMDVYHSGSIFYETEASITVSVEKHQDLDPSVGSSYRLKAVNTPLGRDKNRELLVAEQEPFPIDDPNKAKKILEDQLFKITFGSIPPLELEIKAREEISRDPYLRSSK